MVKKNQRQNENITLSAKHDEMLRNFKIQKSRITEYNNNISLLTNELTNITSQINMLIQNNEFVNFSLISQKDKLTNEIKRYKQNISKLESNADELNYFLKVGPIVHSYYDNLNQYSQQQPPQVNDEEDEEEDKDDMLYEEKKINNQFEQVKIHNEPYVTKSKFQKKDTLENYLRLIDPNYVNIIKQNAILNLCKACANNNIQAEMIQYPADGIQICQTCGIEEIIIVESDKPSFKDPPPEVTYFTYKRINHLIELLAQFQARETTDIPQFVYDEIKSEIQKERITNLACLTASDIREYLKKLKLNKYYDHTQHILRHITGIPAPSINRELEDRLKIMFKEIQGPFNEIISENKELFRSNLISYQYIIHKMLELLGYDDLKIYFPLLKDKEKLYNADNIWRKICHKLQWQFIKSI